MLSKTSALTLSVLLLSTTFTTPSQAMILEEEITSVRVPVLKTYADLADNPAANVPPIKPGDLLLINVGHGMVHSAEWVTVRNTEPSLLEKHTTFMTKIKEVNEQDHQKLTEKVKLATRNEFVKVGEKGLPAFLDNLSNSGINIIPISSRGDDGKCATEESQGVLSRTENEFVKLGYHYTNWKKPVPFQNPNIIELKDPKAPESHGDYRLRNGTIYSVNGLKPHKSVALVALFNILKEVDDLPSAIYYTDGDKTIHQAAEDLKDVNFGIPLYLLQYTQPQAFSIIEDLKEFYIHRLGDKLQDYKVQFNEVFLGK